MAQQESLYRVGYRQMLLLETYRLKLKQQTIGEAIELINKAKYKHGNLFDHKG